MHRRPLAATLLLGTAFVMAAVVGAAGSYAGAESRAGTIGFLRFPAGSGTSEASLFVIRADGIGLRRLTPPGSLVWAHAWSPDGGLIAYTNRGSLWLIRPDGTGRVRLVSRSQLNVIAMTWSPDGRAIAVLAQDPSSKLPCCSRPRIAEIYVIPTDGGAPRPLVTAQAGDTTRVAGDSRDPAWSPLGDEIAFTTPGGEVRVVRSDGSGRSRRVVGWRPGRTGFGYPTWSPDGRRLALAEGRYDSIYVVDADGSSLRRLTKRAYNEYAFAWSPDGRTILYGREDRLGIYVIGANGSNDHKLTSDSPAPIAWGALAWAPDGRAIAYATDRTGNGDLYVIGADGRNKLRLTRSAHTDLAPSWAPG